MATIRDIAKLSGVSIATVSQVLNNTGRVGDDTRKRVKKVIEDLNYVPNEVARSLYQKKSNLIGVIIPDISNPYYGKIVSSIEVILKQENYQVILAVSKGGDIDSYQEAIQIFSQNNVSGIISSSFNVENLRELKIPLVLFDEATNYKDIHRVTSDNILGGKYAAQAIIEGNPKRVIVQHGPLNSQNTRQRLNSAIETLKEHQIPYSEMEVEGYTYEISMKEAEKLFTTYSDFDSVIAANDILAAAIINKCHELGIKVPDELQVVGYDNSIFSTLTYPPLTTISQNIEEIGKSVAQLLLNVLKDEDNCSKIKIIDVELIKRGSTRIKS